MQTDGQNYGLMAFEPGEEPVCVLDGDPAEWGQEDLVLEQDGMRVFARYDAEGLYLMADGLRSGEQIYLPIDISPDLGSNTSTTPELSFARKADFLLCLDGETNSRLLVWERYDAMRENFLYEAEGEDPFVEFPGLDSTEFVPIYMALENDLLLDDISPENRILQRLGKWETGRLVSGNGDPESPDYNSLADICYGDGCVELRLPWLLLNVGDPSKMAVHKDYYVNYGVEFESVKELWIGIARDAGTEEIPMAAFSLKGWGTKISYRERLKQSYTVMQELWGGDGNNAYDG